MSCNTSSTFGYGVDFNDIENCQKKDGISKKKALIDAIEKADGLFAKVAEAVAAECEEIGGRNEVSKSYLESYVSTESLKEIIERISGSDSDLWAGEAPAEMYLAYLLIGQEYDIDLELCIDDNDLYYLLYTPSYPWFLNEAQKDLKEEEMERIFKETFGLLGFLESSLNVGYRESSHTS